MGLYFRKSINLGGGIRLNFSKSGVGISGGVKGFRVSTGPKGTRLTASIPGTGVYYSKNLSTKSGNKSVNTQARTSENKYPYVQTVTNQYTGEYRTVRAATRWELNSAVIQEIERQHNNEMKQRAIDYANSQKSAADELTAQIVNNRLECGSIIAHTLDVDDKLDWNKQYKTNTYSEFIFDKKEPVKPGKRKRIFALFGNASTKELEEYYKAYDAYEKEKNMAFQVYLENKTNFENEVREHNMEIDYLKSNFESNEKSAVEKYISVILANSDYPDNVQPDYDVKYRKLMKTVILDLLLPRIDSFSNVEKYVYNRASDKIIEKYMSNSTYNKFYETTIDSIVVRTIHEVFEAVYTDAIDNIICNGYVLRNDVNDGVEIDDFTESVRCILSVQVPKSEFIGIDLANAEPKSILMKFGIIKIKKYNDEVNEIEPLSL